MKTLHIQMSVARYFKWLNRILDKNSNYDLNHILDKMPLNIAGSQQQSLEP